MKRMVRGSVRFRAIACLVVACFGSLTYSVSAQEVAAWESHHAGATITSLAFSPDGTILASLASGFGVREPGELQIRSVPGAELLAVPVRVQSQTNLVEFNLDGKSLFTCSGSCNPCTCLSSLRSWDIEPAIKRQTAEPTRAGNSVPELDARPGPPWHTDLFLATAISANRKLLAAATKGTYNETSRVIVWDIASRAVRFKSNPVRATALAISPNGRTVAVGTSARGLIFFDTTDGRETASQSEVRRSGPFSYSPDGTVLAAVSESNESIVMLDAASGQRKDTIECGLKSVDRFTYSPDGKLLACTGSDGAIELWDPFLRKRVGRTSGFAGGIACVAISPGAKWLAAASGSKLKVWDLAALTANE